MSEPTKKFIQKRNKKKDRYARMLRKRERTYKNIPCAQFSSLKAIEGPDSEIIFYKTPMGTIGGEDQQETQFEPATLNNDYLTNHINIVYEEGFRGVRIKLQKKIPNLENMGQETFKDVKYGIKVESSTNEEHYNQSLKEFNTLLQQNGEGIDDIDGSLKRYEEYQTHRKELMSTRACIEVKKKFDGHGSQFSEVCYSSKLIDHFGYDVQDFVDTILRGGIPNFLGMKKISRQKNDPNLLIDYSLAAFKQPQFVTGFETMIITKEKIPKELSFTFMFYGNFVKGGAELSNIVLLDQVDPVPMPVSSNKPIMAAHYRFQELDLQERRQFLKLYYPKQYSKLESQLQLTNSPFVKPEDKSIQIKEEHDQNKLIEEKKSVVKLDAEENDNRLQNYSKNYNLFTNYNHEESLPSTPSPDYLHILKTFYRAGQ